MKLRLIFVEAHSLVVHIQSVGNFRSGILHLGNSINSVNLCLTGFAVVVLSVFNLPKFDYLCRIAIFTVHRIIPSLNLDNHRHLGSAGILPQ